MPTTVSPPEVDRVEILTLLDLSLDLLMAGSQTVQRVDIAGTLGEGRTTLRAEHGFSSLVTVVHYTGWKGVQEIARVMPEAFVPNSVGTTFLIEGAPSYART